MDTEQFDRFTVALSRRTPRRAFLILLTALGLTGLVTGEMAAADVCLGNGEHCGRATDPACCSGLCKRKHGSRKKVCKAAPDQGTCDVEQDDCASTALCNNDPACTCYVTTRGASFCGVGVGLAPPSGGPDWDCVDCEQDRDCDQATGKGSRCIVCPRTCGPGLNLCARPCPSQV
jgi:hypothetical protein